MAATPLRMLCWEGYDQGAFVAEFSDRARVDFHAETLLSDAAAAERLCAGELADWDLLNINHAWVRDYLHPRGLIKPLERESFAHYRDSIHPVFTQLLPWSYDATGDLIGIGQRFGPFNLVVNTAAISRDSARDQGFDLANDPRNHGRFGILNYPDFNLFHFCIGAGLNPFVELGVADLARFEATAQSWYRAAARVDNDHHALNRALLAREIDFYISGGVYTASPARLAGHHNIEAITPLRGPIDGHGGIVFSEINCALGHPQASPLAESFLLYLLEPRRAIEIAFVDGTCNPVAQMGDPEVFDAFSTAQLAAIQWDSLEADLARCAHYRIAPQYRQLLDILEKSRIEQGWSR